MDYARKLETEMNTRIRELMLEAGYAAPELAGRANKLAELIVEEFRTVLADEYRKTPLECCGHFLRADEAIAEHFYGVEE